MAQFKAFMGCVLVAAQIVIGALGELFNTPNTLHGEVGWLGILILGIGLVLSAQLDGLKPPRA